MTELAARLRKPRGRDKFVQLLRQGHFGLASFGDAMQDTRDMIRYEPQLAACLLHDEVMRAVIDGFSRYRPGDSDLPDDWSDEDQVQSGAVRSRSSRPAERCREWRCMKRASGLCAPTPGTHRPSPSARASWPTERTSFFASSSLAEESGSLTARSSKTR